jgi:hypothetical protein
MPVDWRAVYSSTVAEIGHDQDTNELFVRWRDGKTSVYSAVSPEKAESVMTSWSVGKALHQQIKPQHEHRYQEEET